MKRNFLMTSTFFVTMIVYLFAISSWVFIQSFAQLLDRWSHRSELTIYLKPDAKGTDIQKIKTFLADYSDRTSASFQSPEEIRKSLSKLMPKTDFDISGSDDLVAAIPPHFIVKGTAGLTGDNLFDLFKTISDQLLQNPLIDSTSYGRSWAEKYTQFLESFRGANLLFLFGLGLTLILVIGNTIRSHINARREEIEILELVGATPGMIRKPFLVEGTLLSIVSMTIALGLAAAFIHFLKTSKGELFAILDFESTLWQLPSTEWAVAIAASSIIGFLGSYFCLTEINTGWAASRQKSRFQYFGTIGKIFGKSRLHSNG